LPQSHCVNLGSGRGYSVMEVLNAIENVTGHSPKLSFGEKDPSDVHATLADIKVALETLEWRPCTELEEGIRKQWEFSNRIDT